MSDSKTTSGGIGFFSILGIAFIVLKLCKVIDWSWWWVTGPLWMPLTLVIVVLLVWLPFWLWKEKDKRNRVKSGYNEYGWKKEGRSKWKQRLAETQEAQKKEK